MLERLLFARGRAGRRWLVILVTALAMGSLVGSLALAQGDTPRRMSIGDTVSGTLTATEFARVFFFEAGAGSTVSVIANSTTPGLSLAVLLTDATGLQLVSSAAPGGAEVALRDITLPTAGTYYITVLRSSGAEGESAGQFTLSLQGSTGEPAVVTLSQGLAITLNWTSIDDLDLEIRDPVGGSVFWNNVTVPSGGTLSGNANNGCSNTTRTPAETIRWPAGEVPVGSYEILVYFNRACNEPPVAQEFTITVTVDGAAQPPIRATLNLDEQYVASFILDSAGQVTLREGGANPLLLNLAPFAAQIAAPRSLGGQTQIQGRIDRNNEADVWAFEGLAGQVVTIDMNAIQGGSLDTQLILLGPDRNVVASNDDASPETRDSRILNQRLPQDGTYLIVATRFGKNLGGTEGNYLLTISGLTPAVAGEPLPTPSGPVAAVPTPIAAQAPAVPGLPAGSIQVTLLWNNGADVRLLVRDPELRSLFSDNRQLPSGALLFQQDNLNCQNTTTTPITYAYWPLDTLPVGTYEVQVWMNNQCNEPIPPNMTLIVSVRGQEIIRYTDRPDVNRNLYVTSFTVDNAGAATAGTGGLFTRQLGVDLGDISQQVASAQPIVVGRPITGLIDANNTFNVYTFQARAGDRVRITQRATGGTLDSFLYLLDSTGAQINFNDDIVPGIDRNARIDQVIPADGGYVIISTRFGGLHGGTAGTYELSLTPLTQ